MVGNLRRDLKMMRESNLLFLKVIRLRLWKVRTCQDYTGVSSRVGLRASVPSH